MPGSILIAEDDNTSREMLARVIAHEGYAVMTSVDGEDALQKLNPDTSVALVDLRMPKMGGMACLLEMKALYPQLPIVVISSAGTKDAVQAMQNGAYSYIQKPFRRDEVLQVIQDALEQRSQARHRHASRASVERASSDELINTRSLDSEILATIDRISEEKQPILIVGERGTPKELAAEYVHRKAKRGSSSLIRCGLDSISIESIREELFGAEGYSIREGQLEGVNGRIGLARDGSLFLGEISRAPFGVQRDLFLFMKERDDIQWIVTSRYDLHTLIQHGYLIEEFRDVFSERIICLPPLRERRAQIAHQVHSLLRFFESFVTDKSLTVTEEAMNSLIEYSWPGNLEQLEWVLEKAIYQSGDGVITGRELSFQEVEELDYDKTLVELAEKPLREIENFFISWQLRKHRGNRSAAARSLGITDRTIYNRIKQFGLE